VTTPGSVGDPGGDLTQRPKRRAAAAATSSLKEPSLAKKMRRGDPEPKVGDKKTKKR